MVQGGYLTNMAYSCGPPLLSRSFASPVSTVREGGPLRVVPGVKHVLVPKNETKPDKSDFPFK